MKHLSLEKSVKGAIKLVTALKLPNLAERFNAILEVGQTSRNGLKSFNLSNGVSFLYTHVFAYHQLLFFF